MPHHVMRVARQRLACGCSVFALLFTLGACGAGSVGGPEAPAAPGAPASEAVWASLAEARPATLDGAMRISVGEVALFEDDPWALEGSISVPLAFSDLIAAGLLRRADVHFVERRRFTAAADAVRGGEARPRGAPPVGVSPGPEMILEGSWATLGGAVSFLELRLVDAETGRSTYSWRVETPAGADAVALARVVVGSLLTKLRSIDRLPTWNDPRPGATSAEYVATGIEVTALSHYLRGLAAEEVWDWEGAREGYQAAAKAAPDFFEARVALARTARLRAGGTLAAN